MNLVHEIVLQNVQRCRYRMHVICDSIDKIEKKPANKGNFLHFNKVNEKRVKIIEILSPLREIIPLNNGSIKTKIIDKKKISLKLNLNSNLKKTNKDINKLINHK